MGIKRKRSKYLRQIEEIVLVERMAIIIARTLVVVDDRRRSSRGGRGGVCSLHQLNITITIITNSIILMF